MVNTMSRQQKGNRGFSGGGKDFSSRVPRTTPLPSLQPPSDKEVFEAAVGGIPGIARKGYVPQTAIKEHGAFFRHDAGGKYSVSDIEFSFKPVIDECFRTAQGPLLVRKSRKEEFDRLLDSLELEHSMDGLMDGMRSAFFDIVSDVNIDRSDKRPLRDRVNEAMADFNTRVSVFFDNNKDFSGLTDQFNEKLEAFTTGIKGLRGAELDYVIGEFAHRVDRGLAENRLRKEREIDDMSAEDLAKRAEEWRTFSELMYDRGAGMLKQSLHSITDPMDMLSVIMASSLFPPLGMLMVGAMVLPHISWLFGSFVGGVKHNQSIDIMQENVAEATLNAQVLTENTIAMQVVLRAMTEVRAGRSIDEIREELIRDVPKIIEGGKHVFSDSFRFCSSIPSGQFDESSVEARQLLVDAQDLMTKLASGEEIKAVIDRAESARQYHMSLPSYRLFVDTEGVLEAKPLNQDCFILPQVERDIEKIGKNETLLGMMGVVAEIFEKERLDTGELRMSVHDIVTSALPMEIEDFPGGDDGRAAALRAMLAGICFDIQEHADETGPAASAQMAAACSVMAWLSGLTPAQFGSCKSPFGQKMAQLLSENINGNFRANVVAGLADVAHSNEDIEEFFFEIQQIQYAEVIDEFVQAQEIQQVQEVKEPEPEVETPRQPAGPSFNMF